MMGAPGLPRRLAAVPGSGLPTRAENAHGGITVAGLAASGGALLRAVHVPAPDARIVGVEIYDAASTHEFVRGSLLLGVGLDPVSPQTANVLAEAGAQGVTAIALAGEPDAVGATARADTGIAVFAAAPGAGWGHLHTITRALTIAPTAGRELMAPYGDLFAVANAVAARVGGPATIEDADSRLLAFSTPQDPIDERRRETILGRATPDEHTRGMRHAGIFLRLHEGDEPVLLPAHPAEGLRARLAIAIKAGEEVLGYLWVVEGDRPLDARAATALQELAPVVAVHLLRVIVAGSAERNRRRDLVSAALDGAWSADQVAELQLRRGERVIVACIAATVEAPDIDDTYLGERACQIIELHLETYRARGMVTRRGSRVFCLLPVRNAEASSYQREAIGELLEKLAVSLGVAFRAGIGEPVAPHAIRGARADAESALQTGQVLGLPNRATHIADVRDQALLVTVRDIAELRPLLERGSVVRLREHDAARDTAYEATLRAYLDCQCSIPAASSALQVHPNTLRYRLTRLKDVFAIDLEDSHERLALSLQLWLLPRAEQGQEPDEHQ